MSTPNFASILDKAPTHVERPKALPVGGYLCVVKGLPKFDKSSKKQTPYVEFTLQPMQAMDDVDEDALKEVLTKEDGTVTPLSSKSIRATYYLTEDALWRLQAFLEHLGFELDGETSMAQMVNETQGRQVIAYLKHEASDDGESVFAKLGGTAAVE